MSKVYGYYSSSRLLKVQESGVPCDVAVPITFLDTEMISSEVRDGQH